MDVTVNEAGHRAATNPTGAPKPAGVPQLSWPGTSYAATLVVACVDVAATTGLAAFKAAYTRPGAIGAAPRQYDAAAVRATLVTELAKDLGEGAVALGFEAPLWGLENGPLGPFRPRTFKQGPGKDPFEVGATAWYGQAGAQAAAKVLHLVKGILDGLSTLVGGLKVTFGDSANWGMNGPSFNGGRGELLLWEAFVVGQPTPGTGYKPPATLPLPIPAAPGNPNISDAFFAVEYGYANTPAVPANPVAPAGQPTAIAGAAIQLAGLAVGNRPWWETPCLVIGPRRPKPGVADLLWP